MVWYAKMLTLKRFCYNNRDITDSHPPFYLKLVRD
jgi:hypothetical protein